MKNENSKIDVFYKCLVDELQLMRAALMNEMKYSAAQMQALYNGLTADKNSSSAALEQEIRYGYKQNQNIYEGLAVLVKEDIAKKIDAIEEKLTALEQLSALVNDLGELKYSYQQLQTVYETLAGDVTTKLAEMATKEEMKESLSVHSQEILNAIASLPVPESVDYERITAEVGDKFLELIADIKASEEDLVDYERVACETATKVMECMPYADPVDYNQIEERVEDVVSKAVDVDAIAEAALATVNTDAIAEAVADKLEMPTIDYDKIAEEVSAKIVLPAVEIAAPEIDYDKLAESLAAKIALPTVETTAPEVDYEKLADMVAERMAAKEVSADVILDEEGVAKLADRIAEKNVCPMPECTPSVPAEVDYDRVAAIVEEKIAQSYEKVEQVVALDEEGIDKIVGGIAEELRNMTLVCEYEESVETPVEEAAEEVAEEVVQEEIPVEEIAEEIAVEEVVEETPVEEAVQEVAQEEPPVQEVAPEASNELAVAMAEPVFDEDLEGQLIDAQTGLVVRMKRSFTAKMRQSEAQVKAYYSDIKNALTSYKKINSNVSWHGDRFNCGRETVAKMGINGKTLCFYLALDPHDEELKTTVYHQKDVGGQKAYESTPFMVKVKSDAAAKKALRLVNILAEKLGVEHDESFEEVDYVAEYSYETTKRLYEEGEIKVTQEKKVDFNF